ncbi:hypothetical protein BDW74DRAFT_156725 [Aspergillus multicolor]|uniref:uncharacterized protein n=1 Tax=Aspergillus multicolor TaxID=41759 RepID=UPI003CCCDAF3
MEVVWQDGSISECAKLCLQLFNQCLDQFYLLSPKQQSEIDDQFGRFSIWLSNIGVFAPTRGSLDYRLREAPDIQRLVRRLLRTLNDQIQQYITRLGFNRPVQEFRHENPVSESESLGSLVSGMAEEITLMHQLSNTIRKASRDGQNEKAATAFKILDDDGNDIGQCFMDHFALEIIQRRFPGCDRGLQKRLAATMLLRRKRILYRRSRYMKAPSKTSSAPDKLVPNPTTLQAGLEVPVPIPIPVAQASEPIIQKSRSTASSRAVTATTLNLELWKRASAPSVISRAKTIDWTIVQQFDFPPPPLGPIQRKLRALKQQHVVEFETLIDSLPISERIPRSELFQKELEKKMEGERMACNNGSMEVICPYCCCSLSSTIVTNKLKWIEHVKYDLDPYVCLFDNCSSPTDLYNHSEDWIKHMRQHRVRWRCTAKSHGVLVFHTKDEYEEHMTTKHKSTKSQLAILAERSSRSSGPLFECCPLCGKSGDPSLEEHIASHLRFLALKSLPFPDDEGYDNGSEVLRSEFQSSGARTRSTMLEESELLMLSPRDSHMDDVFRAEHSTSHSLPSGSRAGLGQDRRPNVGNEPGPDSKLELEELDSRFSDDHLYNGWSKLSYKQRARREKMLTRRGLPIPDRDFPLEPPEEEHGLSAPSPPDTGGAPGLFGRFVESIIESRTNLADLAEAPFSDQRSDAPGQSHYPPSPTLPVNLGEIGCSATGPNSSGWEFIDHARSTVYDAASDPILASLLANTLHQHTKPDSPLRPRSNDPSVDVSRADPRPIKLPASLYASSENSSDGSESDMVSYGPERPEQCPIITCNYHTRGFARKLDKQRHLLTHYRGSMMCGFCPDSISLESKNFDRADVFKRHLFAKHGAYQENPGVGQRPKKAVGCSNCSDIFFSVQEFYRHVDKCTIRAVMRSNEVATVATSQNTKGPNSSGTNFQEQLPGAQPPRDRQTLALDPPADPNEQCSNVHEQRLPRRQDRIIGSSSVDNAYMAPMASGQDSSVHIMLCHACGKNWTSSLPFGFGCPNCHVLHYSEVINLDESGGEIDAVSSAGNGVSDFSLPHFQYIPVTNSGASAGSAPEAINPVDSARTATLNDDGLFSRAMSGYRDHFMDKHSYLPVNERLVLWEQRLSQFLPGGSDAVDVAGSHFAEPQHVPVKFDKEVNRHKLTSSRLPSILEHNSYVSDLDAETVARANAAVSSESEHSDEGLKRPYFDNVSDEHVHTVAKAPRTGMNEFANSRPGWSNLVSSSPNSSAGFNTSRQNDAPYAQTWYSSDFSSRTPSAGFNGSHQNDTPYRQMPPPSGSLERSDSEIGPYPGYYQEDLSGPQGPIVTQNDGFQQLGRVLGNSLASSSAILDTRMRDTRSTPYGQGWIPPRAMAYPAYPYSGAQNSTATHDNYTNASDAQLSYQRNASSTSGRTMRASRAALLSPHLENSRTIEPPALLHSPWPPSPTHFQSPPDYEQAAQSHTSQAESEKVFPSPGLLHPGAS